MATISPADQAEKNIEIIFLQRHIIYFACDILYKNKEIMI